VDNEQSLTSLLLETYDYVWSRLLRRLEGLTDPEFLWEPVPGCWTIRRLDDGTIYRDPGVWPEVEPSPVTTIAWRVSHIADNFTERRIGPLFGRQADPRPPELPLGAAEGVAYARTAFDSWRAHLASVTDRELAQPLDQGTTPYEGQPLTRFVLQYLEELAHHAAEVALLRDLYRVRAEPGR
jgi:hypothetical protein